ncbi:hypothetical protein [Methylocaldum szegediense]|uniref:hypothetical protein n=1 Tax=Methylocaldum szegediense TaxID=73780 RepID=UPI0003F83016|nr:hypothetical protein [Methylocaldum szegediense]
MDIGLAPQALDRQKTWLGVQYRPKRSLRRHRKRVAVMKLSAPAKFDDMAQASVINLIAGNIEKDNRMRLLF